MGRQESEKRYFVTVAGIGPGAGEGMTEEVKKALEDSDIIVGYPLYIGLIRDDLPQKEYLSTPMREEESRCRLAFEKTMTGKKVTLICGGDPGVYSLAALMLTLAEDYPECEVRILPGVTAATAGAALLGAPLTHDFAAVSLSDSLTPWEKIEKRLRLAAEADLVICLYNPASKARPDSLKKAVDILLYVTEPERVCGVARNIGRKGEESFILTLEGLRDFESGMSDTIFIGNSETRVIEGKMVTPRGYAADFKGQKNG